MSNRTIDAETTNESGVLSGWSAVKSDDVLMTRKVQQLGSSTLAVTVPADWARQYGIEKGDEIVVQRDELGGSLLLVPDRTESAETDATVDATDLPADLLEEAVLTQYVLGRQLITIESDEPLSADRYDAVLAAERRLMGLGIVEETPDSITVRCSVAPEDFGLPTLLGRLGRTEATMREDAVGAILDADTERAERALGRQRQVEKLYYLFLRLVFATYRNPRLNHTVGLDTGFPLLGYRSAAQDVALMTDVAATLGEMATETDFAPAPASARDSLSALAEAVADGAASTRSALTDPTFEDIVSARDALGEARERASEAEALLEDERPEPLLALHKAVLLLSRDIDHLNDSLDVATRLAFRRGSATPGED
jgi:phosphate uptake regulator